MKNYIKQFSLSNKNVFIVSIKEFGIKLSGVRKNGGGYFNLWAM